MASNEATSGGSDVSRGDGDKNLKEKKVLVTERLHKREEERQDSVQKRRDEKEKVAAVDETSQHFIVNFARERQDLEKDLCRCDTLERSQLSAHFDKMSVGLLKLQKSLADATIFLPAYEVRHAQEAIATLQTDIQSKRIELLPKKKFAFKSKKKTTDNPDGNIITGNPLKQQPENETVKDAIELAECKFVDQCGKKLEMSGEKLNLKDVALARLSDCTVLLKGSPKAVHVRELSKCRVLCGPVGGSIFITDCTECTFVLSCQQLRIHTTKDTQFYIHVTSRAIVEDTSSVSFAPYNWTYEGIDEDFRASRLDCAKNNWHDIDDFNWLASDKHSPNWSLIAEEDRVKQWCV